jgi:hypothetical protein
MFPDIPPSSATVGQAYTRNLVVAQDRIDALYGDPQINVPHPYQQYKIGYSSDVLSGADLDALRDHFAANAATYFSFFCFWGSDATDPTLSRKRSIPKMTVATVVHDQLIYTLPAKAVDTPTLYDGAGAVIASSRYDLNPGAGSEGADNVTFHSTGVQPAAGILTFSAVAGRRRFAAFYVFPQEFPEAWSEGDVWILSTPLQLVTSVTLT